MVSKTHRQYLTQSRSTGKDEKTPVSLSPVRWRVITLHRKSVIAAVHQCDYSITDVWHAHSQYCIARVCEGEGKGFLFSPPSFSPSLFHVLSSLSFLSSSISPSLPLSSSPSLLLEQCAPILFLQWGVATVAGQTDRSVVELYYRCQQ